MAGRRVTMVGFGLLLAVVVVSEGVIIDEEDDGDSFRVDEDGGASFIHEPERGGDFDPQLALGVIPPKQVLFNTFGSSCKCQINLPTEQKSLAAQPFANASKLPACTATELPWASKHMITDNCWVEDLCKEEMIANIPECLERNRKDANNTTTNRPTMFLFGDSVSMASKWGIMKAANGAGFNFRSFLIISCTLARKRTTCDLCDKVWAKQKETLNAQLRPGDVVTVMLHHTKFHPHDGEDTETLLKHLRTDLLDLRSLVASKDASMVLIGDVNRLPMPGTQCTPTAANPFADRQCQRPRADIEREFADMMKVYKDIAAKHKNVKIFDINRLFCNDKVCGAMIPGTIVTSTYDHNHFTAAGGYYIWPFLCDFLATKLPKRT